MSDQPTWDRLRAALDGWEAPRGLSLAYAIDERTGLLSFNLLAPCGEGVGRVFASPSDVRDCERFMSQPRVWLDSAAVDVLREHMCCQGRPPRSLAYAARAFWRWADRYRYNLDARKARSKSPWRTRHG